MLAEMYSCILIGFLVRGRHGAAAWASRQLEDPSLRHLVDVIHRALQFYASTGTLLPENEKNLTGLVTNLGSTAFWAECELET